MLTSQFKIEWTYYFKAVDTIRLELRRANELGCSNSSILRWCHIKKEKGNQTKVLNIYIYTMCEQINESYGFVRSQ
jgi:intein-encoded DNA endonuclease-like protein